MSSTKTMNYSAFKASAQMSGGVTKSPLLLSDRLLRQTTTAPNLLRNSARFNRLPTTLVSPITPNITPKVTRRPAMPGKALEPLQSPQLIRSQRLENNWNKNKCQVHSKSPGSGTSIESIVPKYQLASPSSQNSQNSSFPQKRAYNVNKTSNKTTNKIVSSSRVINKEMVPIERKFGQYTKQTLKSTISTSSTSSASSSTKSFSSKFPSGLPFEDEFYHYRQQPRTNLHHHQRHLGNSRSSIASDSFSNNSDDSNPRRSSCDEYEDEFARKPSNEPLYVDFTMTGNAGNAAQAVHKPSAVKTTYKLKTTAQDNCFCEFESVRTQKCKPVVYVAVASWVPKCNAATAEPTAENSEYVEFISF